MHLNILKTIKKCIAVTLCAAFCIGMSSCSKDDNPFPKIPAIDNDVTSETTETSIDPADNRLPEITVALPYSETTLEYLSKLYYAKTNNLMGDNTGANVDLKYLSSLNSDFIIHSIVSSNEGANTETLRQWDIQNELPDLFLTADVDSAYKSGYASVLDPYMYDDELINANNIFIGSVNEQKIDGKLYGIPHYSSVMLLVGNVDYIPDEGKLPNKYTTSEFVEYLSNIKKQYKDIIPLSSGSELLPYLGSSFMNDSKVSYMLYKEYISNSASYDETLESCKNYISNLYSNNLTSNVTTEGADPVYSRKAAVWLSSSSNISFWNNYYPNKLYFLQLPSNDVNNPGVPYNQVYSLCVSNKSEFKEFAADFASFISFDIDAVLLINRLENQSGFFPIVKNQEVWKLIEANSILGVNVATYYQILDNSVYVPHSKDNKIYSTVSSYISTYSGGEIKPEALYGN